MSAEPLKTLIVQLEHSLSFASPPLIADPSKIVFQVSGRERRSVRESAAGVFQRT